MKRIIDGKIYNTETAIEISFFETSCSTSDFRYRCETLYKTKKGVFFLAGKGHALTKWATHSCGSSGWGEGIIVLSTEKAREWCERNDIDCEIIEKNFQIEEA